MGQLIEQNGEFFIFVKREFPNEDIPLAVLEKMFIAYIAGKYGMKPQVPALEKK